LTGSSGFTGAWVVVAMAAIKVGKMQPANCVQTLLLLGDKSCRISVSGSGSLFASAVFAQETNKPDARHNYN
jgi:hypothetical protein